jgi:hypothetical protein
VVPQEALKRRTKRDTMPFSRGWILPISQAATHPRRFSITKWIHLNGGDEGLLSFFRKIYAVLKAGGLLLLEPQGWEGYAKARKMTPVRLLSF